MVTYIINGDGLILGRVASYVAKNLMKAVRNGEDVSYYIINAEKMVISGDRQKILNKYIGRRSLKNKANPEHSPKWPKRPDYFVKRVIKGMLPIDKASGRTAWKRVKAFIGEEKVSGETVELPDSFKKDKLPKYMTVLELSQALNYRPLIKE